MGIIRPQRPKRPQYLIKNVKNWFVGTNTIIKHEFSQIIRPQKEAKGPPAVKADLYKNVKIE